MVDKTYNIQFHPSITSFSFLEVSSQLSPNLTVRISPGGFWHYTYNNAEYIEYPGGDSPVIIPPESHSRIDVICINSNGEIIVINGKIAEYKSNDPYKIHDQSTLDINIRNITSKPEIPIIPKNVIPLAGIYINSSTTEILENDIFDIRPFLEFTTSDNISTQRINTYLDGQLISNRYAINFIEGIGISFTCTKHKDSIDIIIGGSPLGTFEGAKFGTSVSLKNSFGITPSVGTSKRYSGGLHSHGTPTNPVPSHESLYNHTWLHSNINDPTSNEKAALTGTAGVPSIINRYATDLDPRLNEQIAYFEAPWDLLKYRIVVTSLEYANNQNLNHYNMISGMVLENTFFRDQVPILLFGKVTNPSWNWDITKPLYLGINGLMTQSFPDDSILLIVGAILSPTTIFFRPTLGVKLKESLPKIISIYPDTNTINNIISTSIEVSFNKSMNIDSLQNIQVLDDI